MASVLRYEERIIELHSVIAELSKKMEEEKDDVIKEESECDESQVGTKSNFFETSSHSKSQDIQIYVAQVEDSASIATDSFIDEKLVVGEEFEDYTSLAFERDLEMHTRSLRKSKGDKKNVISSLSSSSSPYQAYLPTHPR